MYFTRLRSFLIDVDGLSRTVLGVYNCGQQAHADWLKIGLEEIRFELDFWWFDCQRPALVELLVLFPWLRVEDEETTRSELCVHFQEKSFDTSISKVKVDPLYGRKAKYDIKLLLVHNFVCHLLDVVLAAEQDCWAYLLRVDIVALELHILIWLNSHSCLHVAPCILQVLFLADEVQLVGLGQRGDALHELRDLSFTLLLHWC